MIAMFKTMGRNSCQESKHSPLLITKIPRSAEIMSKFFCSLSSRGVGGDRGARGVAEEGDWEEGRAI